MSRKTLGSGRKKGTGNKVPYDLKLRMRDELSPKAVDRLERIIADPDAGNTALLKAIELVLAYGHGKPQQNQLHAVEAGPNLSKLMVRFMQPGEDIREVREANSKVIDHLDPVNPKRKAI